MSKLHPSTNWIIEKIRKKYHESGKKIGELATEYGLSTDTIRRILYK